MPSFCPFSTFTPSFGSQKYSFCYIFVILLTLSLPRQGFAAAQPVDEEQITVTAQTHETEERLQKKWAIYAPALDKSRIEALPQGDNTSLSQALLHLPGLVQDGDGEVHVRGAHNGLTYRINGIFLPEGLKGFGQAVDMRIIDSLQLLTGALPAEFGFRTAGIIDITAKKPEKDFGGNLSLYGGSYESFKPSLQLSGKKENFSWFSSLTYNQNNIGIENPVDTFRPIHDQTRQITHFSFLSWKLGQKSELFLIENAALARFNLPNTPNAEPENPDYDHGSDLNSARLRDYQNEQTHYLVLGYKYRGDRTSFKIAPYFQYNAISYHPDIRGNLVFQSAAQRIMNDFSTEGVQADLKYHFSGHHYMKLGLIHRYIYERLHSHSYVFPTDDSSQPTSLLVRRIDDNSHNTALENGIYWQDYRDLPGHISLISGLRYDRFDASFDHEGQLSPRLNILWRPNDIVSLHTGYARYFAPASPQYVGASSLGKFVNTTNAPEIYGATAPKVERSHVFDAGLALQLPGHIQFTTDCFYKSLRNMTDLGQFGRAVIFAPFSYRLGRVYGDDSSISWHHHHWMIYGNFSWLRAYGKDINAAQYQFDAETLAYSRTHTIALDHQGKYTASAGISWRNKHHLLLLDFLYGNGLRRGFSNLEKEPAYAIFNTGYQYTTPLSARYHLTARLDVINLFDHRYQLRDGSGIGVSQARYGQRRGGYLTLGLGF